jgi:hypothetical protein
MTNLIIAGLIGLPLYAAFCLLHPDKPCRRCGGWGGKPSRRRRGARRHCRRCDGTGRRFRVPARIIYRVRGAMRRHAALTVRAADRAAGTPPGTGNEDRERVRS